MRARLLAGLVALSALGAVLAFAGGGDEARLLAALAGDGAYKVRMLALRVLTERATERGGPTDSVLSAVGRAATEDESYLVRGLACHALGGFGDARAVPVLTRALGDAHPFVRVRAEEALGRVQRPALVPTATVAAPSPASPAAPAAPAPPGLAPAPAPPPPGLPARPGAARAKGGAGATREITLRLASEATPGVALPPATAAQLLPALEAELRRAAAGADPPIVLGDGRGRGYTLRASIAARDVEGAAVGFTLRVALTTWPGDHLRHVITARARAEGRSTGSAALARLERKVLEAAVAEAVRQVLAELRGN